MSRVDRTLLIMLAAVLISVPSAAAPADDTPSVEALIAQLDSEDEGKRASAAKRLGAVSGDEALLATDRLLAVARHDESETVRIEAVLALGLIRGMQNAREWARLDADVREKMGMPDPPEASSPEQDPGLRSTLRLLMGTLHSSSPELRAAAARSLGYLWPKAASAALSLTVALRDPVKAVRFEAAFTLAEMEGREKPVLPVLLEALKDRDRSWGRPWPNLHFGSRLDTPMNGLVDSYAVRAVSALRALGPGILEPILQIAGDDSVSVVSRRLAVCVAVDVEGIDRASLAVDLAALISGGSPQVARTACRACGQIGADARAIVPDLATALTEHRDAQVRHEALDAIVDILGREGDTLRFLKAGLCDDGWRVRRLAAGLLASRPELAREARGQLRTRLKDRRAEVADAAASAVAAAGDLDPESLAYLERRLLRLLRGGARGASLAAVARAIWDLGGSSDHLASCLALAMEEPGPVAWGLVELIEDMGPEGAKATGALVRELRESKETHRRFRLARAIGRIGPAAERAFPRIARALDEAVRDPDPMVRGEALGALARVVPRRFDEAVKALVAQMRTPGKNGQYSLYGMRTPGWVLRELGPRTREAVLGLKDLLESDQFVARHQAAWTMLVVGAASERALAALVADLGDEEPMMRHMAVTVIGLSGPAARPAIPALERLLDDPAGMVRMSARKAIETLRDE